MKTLQYFLSSASILLLLLFPLFHSTTTTLAQLSPVQPPTLPLPLSPPTTAAPAPAGLNTVPLVPVTPSGAPTPIIPKSPTIDITGILKKAKRFSVLIRLLKTTQLINQLNSQLITTGSGGLTLFAPDDTAFSKLKPGFLNSLSDRKKVELLQFHTLSSFVSISNFDTLTNPVQTQAGDDPKRLQLNVTTYGGSQVSMTTGAVNATVTGTVYADNKLAIYEVNKVLLPLDVVLPSKAPAPAPAPAVAKGGSPKDGKAKNSNGEGGGDDDESDGGDENKALPGEASSAAMRFIGFEGMWVSDVVVIVVGVALMGGVLV